MADQIILYGRSNCFMVGKARRILDRANAEYQYIDIHRSEEARRRVRELNNGYESVPTLIFPDGSVLTEPSTETLQVKLEEYGYQISSSSLRNTATNNLVLSIAGIVLLVVGLLLDELLIVGMGLVLVFLPVILKALRAVG